MARTRRDVSTLAPWVDWPKVVERVRMTDEIAINGLTRHLELALRLFESTDAQAMTINMLPIIAVQH